MYKKIIVALIIGIATSLLWRTRLPNGPISGPSGSQEKERVEAPSGLVIGRSAIYVSDQAPSEHIAVGFVVLEQPGFVVIHEEGQGAPDAILGVSSLVGAGEVSDLPPIPLSRATRDGETLFAMLHADDGDGAFDPAKDSPVRDAGGEPLMMQFSIDKESSLPDAIKL